MPKELPKTITSYDLIKAFAILSMIIDHTGYYFFLDDNWWRVFGRLCVPIWFFLIGYARSRDFGPKLWIGGFILLGANMVAGMSLLPLNVLFSMLFVRGLIDKVMQAAVNRNAETFMAVCVGLTFLILPSYQLCEYGTQGILLAMFGYIMRNRPEIEDIEHPETLPKLFALFTLCHFIFMQSLLFMFTLPQMIVMSAGLWVVCTTLYYFKPVEYPVLTEKLPQFAAAGVRFLGRRTLEIYVGHLILFKILGMVLEPDRFPLFQWTLQMQ